MAPQHQPSALSDAATAPDHRVVLPLLLVGGVVALLIGGTIALWAHYGTAVFYEMIAAGIAACF